MRGVNTIIGLLAGIVLIGWAVTFAQVQQVPGPGTGVVTVTGDVSVVNRPAVAAAQQGEWTVTLANTAPVSVTNTPAVTVALPVSLKRGARYDIVWASGERETISVIQGGAGTWVRAERTGTTAARWVNLAMARSVTELP